MTRTITRLVLLLATALALPLAAQTGHDADAMLREEDAARRPFDALLRHRAELRLTAQQVRQIETIARQLEVRNAPLRRRLVADHHRWREERRVQLERMSHAERHRELARLRAERARGQQVPEPLRPTVRQMLVHIQEATHRAEGVLTVEQRARASDILRREIVHRRARTEEHVRRSREHERRVREEAQRVREERRVRERHP